MVFFSLGNADVPTRISSIISTELDEHAKKQSPSEQRLLAAFEGALCEPEEVTVLFSGGQTSACWRVTESDGDYSVIYLPKAGYFSLCVDSVFGPLDIGVHGSAVECYASV
jgi:hypothetical protein